MRKPVTATTRSSTSINRGLGRRRRRWTTGGGAGSLVSGASISSTTGSSIARMLRKTHGALLLDVCLAFQVVAGRKSGHKKAQKAQNFFCVSCAVLRKKSECGWSHLGARYFGHPPTLKTQERPPTRSLPLCLLKNALNH